MQRRVSLIALTFMIMSLTTMFQGSASAANPSGLPSDVKAAKISDYNDGDKIEVSRNGSTYEVNLIGEDAPEPSECFAQESADYLQKLLPKGQTIYLESDKTEKDGKDRILRYIWAENSKGKAYLVNELLISKGYAQFKSGNDNTKHDRQLKAAQDHAQKAKVGIWDVCGGPHKAIKKVGSGDNPAPIGTTVEGDGRSITVNSANFFDSYGYFAPEQNRIFLIINVTMTNISTSGKQHSYNEICFAAKDLDTGADYDDAVFNASDIPLSAGDMNPGETVSGDVTLEVSPNSTRVRIKYSTGDAFCSGGSSLYWIITR